MGIAPGDRWTARPADGAPGAPVRRGEPAGDDLSARSVRTADPSVVRDRPGCNAARQGPPAAGARAGALGHRAAAGGGGVRRPGAALSVSGGAFSGGIGSGWTDDAGGLGPAVAPMI